MTEQDLSKYFKTQSIVFANGEYNPYRSISHSPQKQYPTRQGQPYQVNTRGRGGFRPRVVMVDPGRGDFQRSVGYNSIRTSDQDAWGHGPSMSMPGGSMMMNMGAMMPMMGMNMGNFGMEWWSLALVVHQSDHIRTRRLHESTIPRREHARRYPTWRQATASRFIALVA